MSFRSFLGILEEEKYICVIKKGVVSLAKIRKKPKKSINKNINKKSFTQSTPNIAEKLDNEMVAFLDTEFLTSQINEDRRQSLCRLGL